MSAHKVKGHALKLYRRERGVMEVSLYTGVCECGEFRFPWEDRLSVVRAAHRRHLATVPTPEDNAEAEFLSRPENSMTF